MNTKSTTRKRILIIDDDPAIRRLVTASLKSDHDVWEREDGTNLIATIDEVHPQIVLLDIDMPGPDGFSLCRRLRALPSMRDAQIVILSGRDQRKDLQLAYEMGADDYLIKPVMPTELSARVHVHSKLLDARQAARQYSEELAQQDSIVSDVIQQRSEEQRSTQDASIFLLAKFAEARDTDTGAHLVRISHYSLLLASCLVDHEDSRYQISTEESLTIGRLSVLHDIGKVGIPDDVLLKPGALDPIEYSIMQQHSEIGAKILEQAIAQFPTSHFLRCGAVIAKYHHERWDGKGYPSRLAGHDIPLPARIVAVADVFDAMTITRPYREARTVDAARDVIQSGRGTQFDPVVVDLFLEHFEEFRRIHETFASTSSICGYTRPSFPSQLFGSLAEEAARGEAPHAVRFEVFDPELSIT